MRILLALSLSLLIAAGAARAQGGERHLVEAADALDRQTCQEVINNCMRRIEVFTRMKYRRPVPVRVEPRAIWEARLKQQGFGGATARSGLAFYAIGANSITVVPWVIGRYLGGNPLKKTREEWIWELEPILIHELTHAIHHQNFYVVLGGARQASLRTDGLSEEELDISTVEFLIAEGTAELVTLRTVSQEGRAGLLRFPSREMDSVAGYMRKYKPDGRQPYRVLLSAFGYQDGIDMMHTIQMKAGPRGVRAILYRQPPRVLFFQPELLATVDLDDPPEPDSILGFLAPDVVKGGEVLLAVNPGAGRYFSEARSGPGQERAEGCLIGFTAEVGEADSAEGQGRYSFFVADPDHPGEWSSAQAGSLKGLYPSGVKESSKPLPLIKGVQAKLLNVRADDGSLYVRAESGGLVVVAHETKPTSTLEDRVLLALRALYIKRPTPKIYDKAVAEAQKRFEKGGS